MKRTPNDDGVSLIVVLCVVLLIGVVATGLLGFVQASFDEAGAVRTARQTQYAADGAVELAVANVVADKTGDKGTPDDLSCSYSLANANGYTTTVTCAPFDATYGAWNTSKSRNALLALSTASNAITLVNNNPLYVDGPVYSNGGIDADTNSTSTLDSTWTVKTEGTGDDCATRVTADRGVFCGTTGTAAGDDPGWTLPSSPLTSISTTALLTAAVTCTKYNGGGSGGILTFTPGKYLISPTLAVAQFPQCDAKGSTLYFPPGVYDFSGITFTPSTSGSGNPYYDIVAGTAAGSWLTSKSAPPTDGSACTQSAAGAQFLLTNGGKLALDNLDSHLTICAGPSSGQPALAISAPASNTGTVLSSPNKPFVFVYGVVYLPGGTAAINLHNKSDTYYKGGIVANRIVASVSASTKQAGAPVAIPTCSATDQCRSNRKVVFRASINGTERLTSVVDFDDQYGSAPSTSSLVKQWSAVR